MSEVGQAGSSARTRLLQAADELFYAHGITATGVDVVVARAQVAVASLYNLFRNKDGLVVAYLRARDQRWRETWEAQIARHDDPREQVLAIFAALRVWAEHEQVGHGCAHTAAAVQLDDPAHPAMAVVLAHKRHIRDRLTELARAAGEAHPETAARVVAIVYEGLLACSLLEAEPTLDQGRELARAGLGWTGAGGGPDPSGSAGRPGATA